MINVFIDGNQGATGLRILDRIRRRSDVRLLAIDDAARKDANARAQCINASDITFLCLPDAAAIEAVSLAANDAVRIIDASTAHRTHNAWAYGFPELSGAHRAAIANGRRVAVPGCHATGFAALVYPLVSSGLMPRDYPLACHSITGYSGGGKNMIQEYESQSRDGAYGAPRQYALMQHHKHLPEMQAVCGLDFAPAFCPIVADYFAGMEVTVPVFTCLLTRKTGVEGIYELLESHYHASRLIGVKKHDEGFLAANALFGLDTMELGVSGNDERVLLTARLDNLGKGASGAAIQCMNIMLGLDETTGLLLEG